MSVFESRDFDGHEQVVFCHDRATGLRAIIAVHDTRLGPALGGCRMYPYAGSEEALRDVLRLARGMTFKSALAGLPLGGGKAVIMGDPFHDKSEALMRAMGRCIDRLGGRYIGAEDSGTGVTDLKQMAAETAHVAGVRERRTADGRLRDGDPSPYTAHGVFAGIRAAVRHALGTDSLEGVRVAIQGLGNVGSHLAAELHAAGARLTVADPVAERLAAAVEAYGAEAVGLEEIYAAPAEVFAPCALGAVLNANTIPQIRAQVVCGAANNQLATAADDAALAARGILYAPDYLVNAGGLISVARPSTGLSDAEARAKLEHIPETLLHVFELAERDGVAPGAAADRLARARLRPPM